MVSMEPFHEQDLGGGLRLIHPRSAVDHRGAFTTTWKIGMGGWVQENEVLTYERATIRGLHFQRPPFAQAKLIRVISGHILDVAVDLKDLTVYTVPLQPGPWLYIPEGFAHGYLTESDDCLVQYKVSSEYQPTYEAGFLWNDPALGIKWPVDYPRLSDRDAQWPLIDQGAKPHLTWDQLALRQAASPPVDLELSNVAQGAKPPARLANSTSWVRDPLVGSPDIGRG